MYYGINRNGTRTHIDISNKDEEYFCPVCHGILIRKVNGNKISHHFAHKSETCDSWAQSGKSIWHKAMQDHFPEDCQEVCLTNAQGERHIADVFIKRNNKANLVFEFQHSPIGQEEFDRRNKFYAYAEANTDKHGIILKNWVIWVFDMREKNMYISLSDNGIFRSTEADKDAQCVQVLEAYRKQYSVSRIWSSNPRIAKFLCKNDNTLSFRRDIYINRDVFPTKGIEVQMYWKRPNNIFSRISENIYVFFDVIQRKYARFEEIYVDKYGNEHEREVYAYLGDDIRKNVNSDKMYHFFINMSQAFYRGGAYWRLCDSNNYIGVCYPEEDFWKRADALIPKQREMINDTSNLCAKSA